MSSVVEPAEKIGICDVLQKFRIITETDKSQVVDKDKIQRVRTKNSNVEGAGC